jgi:hypothetical protein
MRLNQTSDSSAYQKKGALRDRRRDRDFKASGSSVSARRRWQG